MPIRTCLGCGQKFSRDKLLRFCLDSESVPVVDLQGGMQGRGVYCCKKQKCFSAFVKSRKRLTWAFRKEIAAKVKIESGLIEGYLEKADMFFEDKV